MPIVPAICTQCGAAVEVNDAQDAAICPHCHTPFIIEKAINHYHTTQNYQINGGVVNIHSGPSVEDIYKNARALILDGACIQQFVDDSLRTEQDKALHALYIKLLGIAPDGDHARMLRAALAIAAILRASSCEPESITNYLPLLREQDPEFYGALLKKFNQRFSKHTKTNAHYKGGLLGLKASHMCRETVDRFLVPEEGDDQPFLVDTLYCTFWRDHDQNKTDHAYICRKLYDALKPDLQRFIAGEYERRARIEREVLGALRSQSYKQAVRMITSASEYYPRMNNLLQHFQKTLFSYKCTLLLDPRYKGYNKRYAPDLVHEALDYCPSAVRCIEDL